MFTIDLSKEEMKNKMKESVKEMYKSTEFYVFYYKPRYITIKKNKKFIPTDIIQLILEYSIHYNEYIDFMKDYLTESWLSFSYLHFSKPALYKEIEVYDKKKQDWYIMEKIIEYDEIGFIWDFSNITSEEKEKMTCNKNDTW